MVCKTHRDYYGIVKGIDDLSHNHLSNIHWYNKIIHGVTDEDLDSFIYSKFGIILQYNPFYQFEMEYLDEAGYLVWNDTKTRADIILNSVIIGFYETLQYKRNLKIKKIIE
jgi:hypothetical protein